MANSTEPAGQQSPASGTVFEKGGGGQGMKASGHGRLYAVLKSLSYDQFAFHRQISRDLRLKPMTRLVGLAIWEYLNHKTGEWKVSYDRLAQNLGYDRSHLIRHVRQLIDFDHLQVEKTRYKGHQGANLFSAQKVVNTPWPTSEHPLTDQSVSQSGETAAQQSGETAILETHQGGETATRTVNEGSTDEELLISYKHSRNPENPDCRVEELDPELEQQLIDVLEAVRDELGGDDKFVASVLGRFWFDRHGQGLRGWLTIDKIDLACDKASLTGDDPPALFFAILDNMSRGYA